MAQIEPDSEVIEFAISREVEAYHFYMALAKVVDNTAMRKVLEGFAEEELEHKAKLELEALKMGQVLSAEKQFSASSRDNYIIPNTDSLIDMDYKDILLLAIKKEDASFRTYVNLAFHAADQESKDILLTIAEEEVKHKLRFEIEYDMLMKKR
jgi:rubrerythrin